MQISVAEAKNRLPELIRAVEQGEKVTICRRGIPVADLVLTLAATKHEPKFGTLRDRIVIHDEDWWRPMSDEAIEELLDAPSA